MKEEKNYDLSLCASEHRFMSVIWEREPVNSTQLAKDCLEILGWKKSTVYTMLKKLEARGFLKNENSIVRATVPKSSFCAYESKNVVNTAFGGSLPAFVAAFTNGRKLSKKEAEEIRRIIDAAGEE